MGEFAPQISAQRLLDQLVKGRTRSVTPTEISRNEIYSLVRSLASNSNQGGIHLRDVRKVLELALSHYVTDDLHSSHKSDGLKRTGEALEVLQYTGCFTSALLGKVAALASRSRDTGDSALHGEPLRSAAVETLLCHPPGAAPAEGLKIDALAKILSFFDPQLAPETFEEICQQLICYSRIDLLMSPTVWGVFGLNPSLVSSNWEGKASAITLLRHLGSSTTSEDYLLSLRQLQKKPWSESVTQFCDLLETLGRKELTIRAQCIRLIEGIRNVAPESEDRVRQEISLAKILNEYGPLLASQLMSDGLYGQFHTSHNDGAYRLSGRCGALSAEQIHRISTQPFPVREIHIHGHHDGGNYGIPLSTRNRKDDLSSAQFRLGANIEFFADEEFSDIREKEEDYSIIQEAYSRKIEFVDSPRVESTSTEFQGYLKSPVCRNVEMLNIPIGMVGLVTRENFPHLKELELWGNSNNETIQLALGLPRNLTSLSCSDANFIAALSRSPIFLDRGELQVSKLSLPELPISMQFDEFIQCINRETISQMSVSGMVDLCFLNQLQYFPRLESLKCCWSPDSDSTRSINLTQLRELEIRNCTSSIVQQLTKSTLPQLRALHLFQTSASSREILGLLDSLSEQGLTEFTLCGSLPGDASEIASLLKHHSLRNVKTLRLGLPQFVSMVDTLVRYGEFSDLHTLDLTNPHAIMMDPQLPEEYEKSLLTHTLKGLFSKLTLSFNPAQYSLCRRACESGTGEIVIHGRTFEIYTTAELGHGGHGSTFLIQRAK